MKDVIKRIKKLEKDLPCKVVGATGLISIEFMKESNKKRKNMLKEIEELKKSSQKCPKKSEEKGCGKKVQVGYNKKLDCPITNQCGMTKIYGEVYLCPECSSSSEKTMGDKE